MTAEDVAWLEEQAHLLEKECDIRFKGWARPGKEGSLGSAYLDLARSVCRRANAVWWR
ncbi:MAG: ATP:cob(I)alamin adenosyltransferase [Akkermansia sp.]